MGHISPHAIKDLVKNEFITGLMLDPKSEASFCNACTKAKPTHKPIRNEWTSPFSPNLGYKLHLDVWGLATPHRYDRKDYFIIFTDDYSQWS